MQEVGQEVEGYMTSMFNKDRPDKDAGVVFLTKFIVTPDIGLDFIAEVKKVRELVVRVMQHLSMRLHQHLTVVVEQLMCLLCILVCNVHYNVCVKWISSSACCPACSPFWI